MIARTNDAIIRWRDGMLRSYVRRVSRPVSTISYYPPVHKFTAYHQLNGESALKNLPVTEEVAAQEVTLPLHRAMSEKDMRQVVGTW